MPFKGCVRLGMLVLVLAFSGCGWTSSSGVTDTDATFTSQTSLDETRIAEPAPGPIADLRGVGLDEFFDASFNRMLLRDPERVTELGLADAFGTGNDQLTDISDAYLRETQRFEVATSDMLGQYAPETLSVEQQLSAEIYRWYLDDLVRGHAFMYSDYPVTHFITGAQNQLVHFFTDIHPISSRRDAEDYVKRLSQVKVKLEQLIAGLRIREARGVILPSFIIRWVLRELRALSATDPAFTPFYLAFAEKTADLDVLTSDERGQLLAAAETAIRESVLPGFQALTDYFEYLEPLASNDIGVWAIPDGPAYYEYALRHHTTTDMSADEIHELGLRELSRIHGEMRTLFEELGYPEGETIPELYQRVERDGGTVDGDQIVAEYEKIIEVAETAVRAAFDLRPEADVVVIGGPTGGYYSAPAVDGSRPGAFYARAVGTESRFAMPTLAYHEAVPGHHFQIAIAQELDLPTFRKGVSFTAFVEGWALYAERLAWEVGLYEDDPHGNLGRLQAEAFRAARLAADTGIHDRRWSFEQAVSFMAENTGLPRQMIEFEVSRYATWPGQATAYMIGMRKILDLRERARVELGDRFDIRVFHNVILANGSMPLALLEEIIDNYIEAESSR